MIYEKNQVQFKKYELLDLQYELADTSLQHQLRKSNAFKLLSF